MWQSLCIGHLLIGNTLPNSILGEYNFAMRQGLTLLGHRIFFEIHAAFPCHNILHTYCLYNQVLIYLCMQGIWTCSPNPIAFLLTRIVSWIAIPWLLSYQNLWPNFLIKLVCRTELVSKIKTKDTDGHYPQCQWAICVGKCAGKQL